MTTFTFATLSFTSSDIPAVPTYGIYIFTTRMLFYGSAADAKSTKSRRVRSSFSTSDTRRVNLIANYVEQSFNQTRTIL